MANQINRMRAKTIWLYTLVFCGLIACKDQPLIDQNKNITERRWFREQEQYFTVKVDQPATSYDLFLNLRNSIDFQFSDLYLQIQQKNPDSSRFNYSVKIKMTNGEGLWRGNGSGTIYSQQVRFLSDYQFPDSGTYIFSIKQNMRANPVEGIHDVGFRIAETRQ
ncbi:gliding motility lipoprotein GldH [Albibacterium indicum]|uniref:gliding motility lipoprotein GldH n=1 Tax=Albibacterium indicum TaxID=2292082 RepID=UPI000E4E2B64|nr:gliding motility lipoprotein GldH [Pedobacter indicus]